MCRIAYNVCLVLRVLGRFLIRFNSRFEESLFTRSVFVQFFALLSQSRNDICHERLLTVEHHHPHHPCF